MTNSTHSSPCGVAGVCISAVKTPDENIGGSVEERERPAYTGPGDIASGATAWYGLRAYNRAYALNTGSNPCIDVINADGTGSATTIYFRTDGIIDVAALAALSYASTGIRVSKLYDQTGNGSHLVQNTHTERPALVLNALSGYPVLRFTPDVDGIALFSHLEMPVDGTWNGSAAVSMPYTISQIFKANTNNANDDHNGGLFDSSGTTIKIQVNEDDNNVYRLMFDATTGQPAGYANEGNGAGTPAIHGHWYCCHGVARDSTCLLYVAGETVIAGAAATATFGPGSISYRAGNGTLAIEQVVDSVESGIWPSELSAATVLSLELNATSHWGNQIRSDYELT